MPLIGFITTVPPDIRTCTSGLAPTRVRSPVWTTYVQYAPRSPSSSRRNSASASARPKPSMRPS